MNQALWSLSACELSARLRRHEIQPRDLVDASLERIQQTEPTINALSYISDQSALEQALEESTQRLASGNPRSWLEGLPISVKDNLWVEGMPATWGSRIYENHTASTDDAPVRQLREAGAIIVAKTATPEFALAGVTENLIQGITKNPWDTRITPGGSSGGATASVSCGQTALAMATDAGGSIRRPCGYTGTVGLRPTTGLFPRSSGFPSTTLDFQVVGPIARTVTDCALFVDSLIQTGDKRRIIRANGTTPHFTDGDFVNRRAQVFIDESVPHEPAVLQAITEVVQALNQLRLATHTASPPFSIDDIDKAWARLIGMGVKKAMAGHHDQAELLTPAIRNLYEKGLALTADDMSENADLLLGLRHAASRLWIATDFLITPASPCVAWETGKAAPNTINNIEVGPRAAARYTAFVNTIGAPAVVIPWTLNERGLPIGVQIVAAPWHDHDLLQLAKLLEALAPQQQWLTLTS